MKTRSDRHPRIPVATTPEEFDATVSPAVRTANDLTEIGEQQHAIFHSQQ